MTNPSGLNLTSCEFCRKPGAIPVRFLAEPEWHTVCADCGKAQVMKRLQDEERASWNVGAALGKAYDYKNGGEKIKMPKVVSVGGVPFAEYAKKKKWKKNATTPRRVQTKTRSRRPK